MTYVMWALFAGVIAGGLICGARICASKQVVMDRTDLEVAGWIREVVPRASVLLIGPRLMHPAIIAGRQLFLGDKRAVYEAGMHLGQKLFDFDRVVAQNATRETWAAFGIRYAVEEVGRFVLNASLMVLRSNGKYRLVTFR
jgi:hypothetical protein